MHTSSTPLEHASGSTVRCWGATEFGQDGHGSQDNGARILDFHSARLTCFSELNIKHVACGASHCVVVTDHNAVYVWGNGTVGQLGNGKNETERVPVRIKLPAKTERYPPRKRKPQQDSSSSSSNGDLTNGVLGNGTCEEDEHATTGDEQHNCNGDQEESGRSSPADVSNCNNNNNVSVGDIAGAACGGRHTVVWMRDGTVLTFGNNFFAQLGYDFRLENYKDNQWRPQIMKPIIHKKVIQVSCGEKHTALLFEEKQVGCMGNNAHGQLGTGNIKDAEVMKIVEDLPDIASIACGSHHTVAITDEGALYVWGYAKGCGRRKQDVLAPHLLTSPDHLLQTGRSGGQSTSLATTYSPCPRLVAVSCGQQHNLALSEHGNVYSWGYGTYGQLGHGPDVSLVSCPTRLPASCFYRKTVKITCGENYSVAVTDEGRCYIWGKNSHVIDPSQPANHKTFHPVLINSTSHAAIGSDVGIRPDMPGASVPDADVQHKPGTGMSTDLGSPADPVRDVACGAWHIITVDGMPTVPDWRHSADDEDTSSCDPDDNNLIDDVTPAIPTVERRVDRCSLPNIYNLPRDKTKLTIAEFYAPTPDHTTIPSAPRTSASSVDYEASSRVRSRASYLSRRSSLNLPSVADSSDEQRVEGEAGAEQDELTDNEERHSPAKLSHRKDQLVSIYQEAAQDAVKPDSPAPPVAEPIAPLRRRRPELQSSSAFISSSLADHYSLPREASTLTNQNLVLKFDTSSALQPQHLKNGKPPSSTNLARHTNAQTVVPNQNPSWTLGGRQHTTMASGGAVGGGVTSGGAAGAVPAIGSGLSQRGGVSSSSRAAMVALQRSRTLSSFSTSAIANNSNSIRNNRQRYRTLTSGSTFSEPQHQPPPPVAASRHHPITPYTITPRSSDGAPSSITKQYPADHWEDHPPPPPSSSSSSNTRHPPSSRQQPPRHHPLNDNPSQAPLHWNNNFKHTTSVKTHQYQMEQALTHHSRGLLPVHIEQNTQPTADTRATAGQQQLHPLRNTEHVTNHHPAGQPYNPHGKPPTTRPVFSSATSWRTASDRSGSDSGAKTAGSTEGNALQPIK